VRVARADAPVDLEAIVMRFLERDPANRFPDASALDAALAECREASGWTAADAEAWWRLHHCSDEPGAESADATSLTVRR
jgi:hypothetical protein